MNLYVFSGSWRTDCTWKSPLIFGGTTHFGHKFSLQHATRHCKGNPLHHAFLSWTLPPLQMCLLPFNASSTFWCVFCLLMHLLPSDVSPALWLIFHATFHYGSVACHLFCLPSHNIPWLPGLPPPSHDILQCLAWSTWHVPWHPPHHCIFHCTAALLYLPLLCCAFQLLCSPDLLMWCCVMSHDVVSPHTSDLLLLLTCHCAWPTFCLYHTGVLYGVVPYTYLLISDLFLISFTLYIRPCLQADPYSFLFGSPARYAYVQILLYNNLITFGSPASNMFCSTSHSIYSKKGSLREPVSEAVVYSICCLRLPLDSTNHYLCPFQALSFPWPWYTTSDCHATFQCAPGLPG